MTQSTMHGDLTTSKYEKLNPQGIYHNLTMSFKIAFPQSYGNVTPTPSSVNGEIQRFAGLQLLSGSLWRVEMEHFRGCNYW